MSNKMETVFYDNESDLVDELIEITKDKNRRLIKWDWFVGRNEGYIKFNVIK